MSSRLASGAAAVPRPRVLLLFGSDGIGGIERRLSILLEAFEAEGYACTLAALTASSAVTGLLSHRDITVLDPVRSRSWWRSARRAWRLRDLIRQRDVDVVLAFGRFANALAAVSAAGLGRHVVLSEIVSPFTARRRRWNRTMMQTYRLADALVLQTERFAADIAHLPVPKRCVVIPNPLSPAALQTAPAHVAGPRASRIVAAGRLVKHKRYHDLIEAFGRLAADFPEWDLEICGDGPERSALLAQVERHGLAHRVQLPGHVLEPWQHMRQAAIVAHCAEIEGFCNTLIEALMAGCAVVTSDCPYGPREIVGTDGGLLYPPGDVDALAAQLRRLMRDDALRLSLASSGRASLGRFDVDRVAGQWFDEMARGTRQGRR
ncbi:glycosyltransferase [Gemmatimonas sp.]